VARVPTCKGVRMRILAVDDDEIILALLGEAMNVVGYPDVQTVSSATEALSRIDAAPEPFECFMLDIQMPEMDGIELCQAIRSRAAHKKTPIIMLTAMTERDYVDRAFSAGASDYVTKPFDVLELGTRVKMAERLNEEILEAQVSQASLDKLTESMVNDRQIDLGSTIDVEDVPGFLGFRAFENYLATLHRGSYYSSSLLTVKIDNIRVIHRNCNATDFEFAINDFAEAISNNIATHNSFFTYAGGGIFVCVYNRIKDFIPEDVDLAIQDEIAQMNLVYKNGRHIEAAITVCGPVNPSVFTKPGSLEIIDWAIRNCDSGGYTRQEFEPLPEIDFKRKRRSWLSLPARRRHA